MRHSWFLPLFLLVAGCGGGGSSFVQSTAGAFSYTLAAAQNSDGSTTYNGFVGTISGIPTGDTAAGSSPTIVTLDEASDTRSVVASILIPSSGSVSFGTNANTTFQLYDTINGVKDEWTATGGTASIASRTSGSISVTFTNVTLTNVASTAALGALTLNGTVTFTGS